jgi:hypothetical protein
MVLMLPVEGLVWEVVLLLAVVLLLVLQLFLN